ncbi:MAG: sulfotransferase family protein [Myxococcota bacterium]
MPTSSQTDHQSDQAHEASRRVEPSRGRLPDFLVLGAAKCGTTTLCDLLGRHPDVFVHPRKELDFFCFDARYAKGLDWYAGRFAKAGDARVAGEGSPNYAKLSKHPRAAERIARDLPDAKLIYMARHPLRRMESAWLHARRSGHRSSRSFAKTLRTQASYVDTSHYERQLDAYRRHFPDERILVVFLDDLDRDPEATLERCFRFLGVEPGFRVGSPGERRNVSSGQRVDGVLMDVLRAIPGFRRFDRRAPRGWRRFRRRWLQTGRAKGPEWDDATRDWVASQLAGPTARFLERYGKPRDFWDLSK